MAGSANRPNPRLERVSSSVTDGFENHLDRLQRFIRQPSISATSEGIDPMVALLVAEIEALGVP